MSWLNGIWHAHFMVTLPVLAGSRSVLEVSRLDGSCSTIKVYGSKFKTCETRDFGWFSSILCQNRNISYHHHQANQPNKKYVEGFLKFEVRQWGRNETAFFARRIAFWLCRCCTKWWDSVPWCESFEDSERRWSEPPGQPFSVRPKRNLLLRRVVWSIRRSLVACRTLLLLAPAGFADSGLKCCRCSDLKAPLGWFPHNLMCRHERIDIYDA